jgi:hypothetical protein
MQFSICCPILTFIDNFQEFNNSSLQLLFPQIIFLAYNSMLSLVPEICVAKSWSYLGVFVSAYMSTHDQINGFVNNGEREDKRRSPL